MILRIALRSGPWLWLGSNALVVGRFLSIRRNEMSASKKEADSPPVEKSQQESSHRTFSEFLDCVRQFSVEERRAELTEPGDWMALPLDPTQELNTADGKELLKYVWDHWAEFKAKELEAIQAYFVEHLKGEDNRGIIIANAVRSCMLEHSEELESDDVRIGELKQETQGSQADLPATTAEEQEADTTATNRARVQATTEKKSIFPAPPGTPWGEVKIDFIEEGKIKIEARGNVGEYFYDEIGFGNKRTHKPTKLWVAFRNLAMLNGCVSAHDLSNEIEEKNFSKYISDLRKKLIGLTGIRGDPFFDVAEISNYQARFKLQATFFTTDRPPKSDQSYEESFDEEISHQKFKAKGKRKPTSDQQFKRSR